MKIETELKKLKEKVKELKEELKDEIKARESFTNTHFSSQTHLEDFTFKYMKKTDKRLDKLEKKK